MLNEQLGLKIHQSEVDFIIPNLKEDLGVYVDPFLFYKSKHEEFQVVHAMIRKFFEIAISLIKNQNAEKAREMFIFPEVKETMLGLSSGNHEGRGLGKTRGEIIFNEIISNKDILKNGINHLAEMQLLIEGVGFDMISDMCTNIAKTFFISYTQRQCSLYNIPLENGICLENVFDWDELCWDDIHTNLPINPINGQPILLVPKAVVRRFAEIDYKNFWQTTYRYILRDIEIARSIQAIGKEPRITWKEINEKYNFCKATVIEVLHENPELKREYFRKKEDTSLENVQPFDLKDMSGTDKVETCTDELIIELANIRPGTKDAKKYETLMLRILTKLFSPPLIDPHSQVTTNDGREIIDITFYNGANSGFWNDIKIKHESLIVVVELKNMDDLANEEFFQIATRLNDKRGKFGILISRKKDNLDIQRAYRRLNDERKVIINLTDEDIINLLNNYKSGLLPTAYLNRVYRKFIEES